MLDFLLSIKLTELTDFVKALWIEENERRKFFEDYAKEKSFDYSDPNSWYSQVAEHILANPVCFNFILLCYFVMANIKADLIIVLISLSIRAHGVYYPTTVIIYHKLLWNFFQILAYLLHLLFFLVCRSFLFFYLP
jgi:hypothetical protein